MAEKELSEAYWNDRYLTDNIGWDLGTVSPPLRSYFDQLKDKTIRILIPGAGNAYEAAYLWQIGCKNVHIVDLAEEPLKQFAAKYPDFPESQLHQSDFFEHLGEYDLIIEQTFFCALNPQLRNDYAKKMSTLLKNDGQLVGLMFNREFESGPPFGGSMDEYQSLFSAYFNSIQIEESYNSIEPRQGSELFVRFKL